MNIGRFYSGVIIGLALSTFSTTAWAGETPSADTIVKKTIQASYYPGTDGRAQVSMTMKDSQGRKRKRRFTILRRNVTTQTGGDQQFYVFFSSPCRCQ